MWFIYLALFLSGSVSALTDAEVKEEFTKILMTCLSTNPVELADVVKLKALTVPDKTEAKCLLACGYRKLGTLNDKGVFDLQKSYELAEKSKAGDEKAIANGKKLADTCIKVNDEAVTDGEKGCERAALMFKCVVSNAPKFGFTV